MKKYEAFIFYTMDENHSDLEYIKDWKKGKVYYYNDTYTFEDGYTKEDMYAYMKADLKLVAGGGSTTKHIHNVSFKFLETVQKRKQLKKNLKNTLLAVKTAKAETQKYWLNTSILMEQVLG